MQINHVLTFYDLHMLGGKFLRNVQFVLALLLCLEDSLLLSFFVGKGFSEVADWLRFQESLKWALVLGWFLQFLGWLSLANVT